jgi:hypothetical protein
MNPNLESSNFSSIIFIGSIDLFNVLQIKDTIFWQMQNLFFIEKS